MIIDNAPDVFFWERPEHNPTNLQTLQSPPTRKRYHIKALLSENVLVAGEVIELGVMTGNSINAIASALPDRKIFGFDSWLGLPEDYLLHGTVYKAGTWATTKLPEVPNNVELISGWFNDSIPVFLESKKLSQIAFLHIDCNLYSSTFTGLTLLTDYIVTGAIILFDDWASPENEPRAFNDWLKNTNSSAEVLSKTGHQTAFRITR